MAVTPNYSWPIPVATDYVKDGWDAIADLGNAIDTTVAGLSSNSMTLLSTTSLTGTSTSITGISQSYTDLIIRIEDYYVTGSGGINMTFNSNTSSTYQGTVLESYNTTVATSATSTTRIYPYTSSVSTSSKKNYSDIRIADYTSTTHNKTINMLTIVDDGTFFDSQLWGGAFKNTVAISSVQINTNATGWAGGTVKIYGVK